MEPQLGRIEGIQGEVASHYSELRRNHLVLTTELGNVHGVSQRFGAYMDQWDSQYWRLTQHMAEENYGASKRLAHKQKLRKARMDDRKKEGGSWTPGPHGPPPL